jgi:TRAP-type C4-dicarboxylate transport system permease small subunit
VRALHRAVAALAGLASALASLATVVCLVLVCVSVAARYLFNMPIPWIDKVAGWLVLAIVLLAASETQRRFEHIGVDVAVGRIGPRLARLAHLLGALAVAVVAGVLLKAGIETVEFSRMIGMQTEVEGVPEWWVQAILPVGAAVLLAVALAQLAALALGREPPYLPKGDEDPASGDRMLRE